MMSPRPWSRIRNRPLNGELSPDQFAIAQLAYGRAVPVWAAIFLASASALGIVPGFSWP
jgi:hypothetical protein